MNTPLARLRGLGNDERGKVTTFVVIIATAVLMFSGLVLDGGLALAAHVRAIGQAQEAARAGAQGIDLAAYRPTGVLHLKADQARRRAADYLHAMHANGQVHVDGDTVHVTVTTTQPTQLLRLVGVGALTVSGSGDAQPTHGITSPEN